MATRVQDQSASGDFNPVVGACVSSEPKIINRLCDLPIDQRELRLVLDAFGPDLGRLFERE